MRHRPTTVVELHFEKVLLGATAMLALYAGWRYLIKSPHTLPYAGRELTPRALNQLVFAEAADLERGMHAVDSPHVDVPEYQYVAHTV